MHIELMFEFENYRTGPLKYPWTLTEMIKTWCEQHSESNPSHWNIQWVQVGTAQPGAILTFQRPADYMLFIMTFEHPYMTVHLRRV